MSISLSKWNLLHSYFILAGFLISIAVKSLVPVVLIALVSFIFLISLQKGELKVMVPFGGYANYITTTRLVLIMIISTFNLGLIVIFIIGLSAFLLDGIDGFVARKLKQESITGVFFDLEVDSFYVLMLSLFIWQKELLPVWILVPAVMRYVFVISTHILRLSFINRRTRFGPLIAGLHFAALLTPFILRERLFYPVCALTSAMVMVSFLYSFYQMLKNTILPE